MGMSASLIGRLGSSTFRLSTTAVSMSLAGSCFSSESAHRPFHYGFEDEVPSKAASYRFFSQLAFPADPNPMQIRATTAYRATVHRKRSGHEHPSAASP